MRMKNIQNAALRAILHKPFNHITKKYTAIKELERQDDIPGLNDRLKTLGKQYYINALLYDNPLVVMCAEDSSRLNRQLGRETQTLIDGFNISLEEIDPTIEGLFMETAWQHEWTIWV